MAGVTAIVSAVSAVVGAVAGGEQTRKADIAANDAKTAAKRQAYKDEQELNRQKDIAFQKRKETVDLQRRQILGATPGATPYSINSTGSSGTTTGAPSLTGSVLG